MVDPSERRIATDLPAPPLAATAIAASILALPALVFWGYSRQLFLLDAPLAVLAFQFYFYLDVVCTMAVVASVAAEPGRRRGALGAVAWISSGCPW